MKRRDEVTVGILITVSVVVLLLGTLWLARGGLKSGYPLYTRFVWGQSLKQGQPVLLAGVAVGYVDEVTLRREGFLDVTLRIDDKFTVPHGSTATVKAIGIFGDVAVALTPPAPVPVESYEPGDTVSAGVAAIDMDQVLNRVDTIGQSVTMLVKSLQQEVIAAGTFKDLQKTIVSAAALSTQLQGVVAEQNKNITETLAALRESANHVATLVDSAKLNDALVSLRETSENTTRLTANIDSTNNPLHQLLAQISHGDGTVGKLMTDSLFYSDTRRLVMTLDGLLADFKANPRKYIKLSIF
jgi:phospholipid/cholesterol/gamma-HCH transport system substrate-binding protein